MRKKGYIPIPKSASKERIVSNTQLYDFEIAEDEMKHLDSLDEGKSCIAGHLLNMDLTQLELVITALVTDWEVTTCP